MSLNDSSCAWVLTACLLVLHPAPGRELRAQQSADDPFAISLGIVEVPESGSRLELTTDSSPAPTFVSAQGTASPRSAVDPITLGQQAPEIVLLPPEPEGTQGEPATRQLDFDSPTSAAATRNRPGQRPHAASWQECIQSPQLRKDRYSGISLNELVLAALQESKQIRVVQWERQVAWEQITQVDAQFDWRLFTQKLWNDLDQPTRTQLEAGQNAARLLQEELSGDAGLRRTTRTGGQFEASQNFRFQHSNSQFISPQDQAFSRLTLRYNQPLLKNGGRLVNEGQVVLAQVSADTTAAETQARINTVILNVVQAYWQIYRRRAEYCIQQNLAEDTRELAKELEQRSKIDAQKSIIAQAHSQLASQLAELTNSGVAIQRAQHELVRQVGDRTLDALGELIPVETPFPDSVDVDLNAAFATALEHRAELAAALRRIKSAQIGRDIAVHQILPQLALIMETSVSGLNGDYRIAKSFGDQFSEGSPSYNIGLSFEVPLGNRAARARARQTEAALARDIASFDDTVDQIRQEVRDAVAALLAYPDQIRQRQEAVQQATVEIETMLKRRLNFPYDSDQISQLYVLQYISALQRRATAEQALVGARVDYAVALVRLRYSLGTIAEMQN